MGMMQCGEKPEHHIEHGVGLLVAARAFQGARPSQHYSSDINFAFERYVGILKELYTLHSVYVWMLEHRSMWYWMERDLDSHHSVAPQNHIRNDFSGRRDVDGSAAPLEQPNPSDSDMHGIHDDESDDDDSHFDQVVEPYLPAQVFVDGAGYLGVNGIYARNGSFERAPRYTRDGEHKGERV